jgi:hypothetical protein
MKKHLCLTCALCAAIMISSIPALTARAEELPPRERELVSRISHAISYMPVLEFPRPVFMSNDRELDEFQNGKKWFAEAYGELKEINPGIDNSRAEWRDGTVADLLKTVKERIERNQSGLDAWLKEKKEQERVRELALKKQAEEAAEAERQKPDRRALEQIDHAIEFGKTGAKWVASPEKHDVGFQALTGHYNIYKNLKAEAEKKDARVIELRREELEFCEKNFVQPYLDLKNKNEEAERKKQEERAKAEAERLARDEKEHQARLALARKMGLKRECVGMVEFRELLRLGAVTGESARDFLIFPGPRDWFHVQNTVGKYVLYTCERGGELLQIALPKEKDGMYIEGTRLPEALFKFTGIETFKTVLGAEKQVPVFAIVKKPAD